MKRYGLGISLLLVSLLSAAGQVTVEVTQDQHQFLQGEALLLAVRITNLSGQTLHLGADEDWLTFSVESRENQIVSKAGEAPVKGEFDLNSSEVATKRVDLAPYFGPMQTGHYEVTATVHIKEWNREINSAPTSFNIIEGAKLWEQDVGVPTAPGASNTVPEVRKFILQQANYLRRQIRLYLRVTDAYGKTYRVFPIGPMVSFGRPEPQVDRSCHLHVLYQNGPAAYSYTVYDLDGNLLTRQTYDYQSSRPRLRLDEEGAVFVMGGVRRVASSDYPPLPPDAIPEPAGVSNSVPAPKHSKSEKK